MSSNWHTMRISRQKHFTAGEEENEYDFIINYNPAADCGQGCMTSVPH